jgi:hypothetical protein
MLGVTAGSSSWIGEIGMTMDGFLILWGFQGGFAGDYQDVHACLRLWDMNRNRMILFS